MLAKNGEGGGRLRMEIVVGGRVKPLVRDGK